VLLKRIIPCLDVDRGRVVKGVKYVDHVDAGDPVEVAQMYDAQEADEITFLDISASHEGRGILLDVVTRTAETVFMPLTVGGGVRSLADIRDLLNAGADKVSIMTAAVENPDLVGEAAVKIGSANLVVAIDARARSDGQGWEVCTHGGRRPTGIDAVEWATRMAKVGAGEILLTSMDRDGTRGGYALEMLRAVADAYGEFFDARADLPLLVVDIDRFDPLRKPSDLQVLIERIASFEGPRESLLSPPTMGA